MPRRNNRRRGIRHPWELSPWMTDDPTFEEMARDLVKRGICSSEILDYPYNWKQDTTS